MRKRLLCECTERSEERATAGPRAKNKPVLLVELRNMLERKPANDRPSIDSGLHATQEEVTCHLTHMVEEHQRQQLLIAMQVSYREIPARSRRVGMTSTLLPRMRSCDPAWISGPRITKGMRTLFSYTFHLPMGSRN